MRDIRYYSVYPSNLNILESFKKLDSFLKNFSFVEQFQYCGNSNCDITLNNNRKLIAKDFAEFLSILCEHPNSLPLDVHSHFKNSKNESIGCIMSIKSSGADIIIESEDIHLISSFHEKIKDIFQLSNPIEALDKKINKYNLKKSIFLAHRFDEIGNKYSEIIRRFVTSLGFQVVEGSGYESRDIPNKVLDKIKTQDILICLVTPGNHSWILSETSTAKALNKHLIIMCQENIEFDKGILGQDFEYMPFPDGFIEKTFTSLLYALPN